LKADLIFLINFLIEISVRDYKNKLRNSMQWHDANAKNARLPFVARARRTHAYVRRTAPRSLHSLVRGSLLRTSTIVTQVTESKVECYRSCEQALYSRFCSLSADEYCSTHSCGTRLCYVRSRVSHCVSRD